MKLRTIIIGGLLVVEAVIFGAVYLFGKSGIKELQRSRRENEALSREVESLRSEIASLQKQQQSFTDDSFYKEKIARERLQMSRPNEQIYLL